MDPLPNCRFKHLLLLVFSFSFCSFYFSSFWLLLSLVQQPHHSLVMLVLLNCYFVVTFLIFIDLMTHYCFYQFIHLMSNPKILDWNLPIQTHFIRISYNFLWLCFRIIKTPILYCCIYSVLRCCHLFTPDSNSFEGYYGLRHSFYLAQFLLNRRAGKFPLSRCLDLSFWRT